MISRPSNPSLIIAWAASPVSAVPKAIPDEIRAAALESMLRMGIVTLSDLTATWILV